MRRIGLSAASATVILFTAMSLPAAGAMRASVTNFPNPSWAGYSVAFTNTQDTPLSASGAWTVPSVNCTANGKPISGEVAVWPGLGGTSSDDLAQIGTDSQCINGKATYWAWYEFVPSQSKAIHITGNGKYPVSAGDSIRATVTEQGAGYFALQIWNDSRSWYYPVLHLDQSAHSTPLTAEWIVEDPGNQTWPQFTRNVVFKNCTWVQNGPQAPLSSGTSLTKYTIVTDTPIVQFPKDITGDPASGGTAFSVQWSRGSSTFWPWSD